METKYILPGMMDFVGPLLVEDLPSYELVFGHSVEYSENCDDWIIHEGKEYEYEITISDGFPDDKCCRVKINDIYYYFG